MNVYRSCIYHHVIAPDGIEQFLPTEDTPWLHRNGDQKTELFRTQMQLSTVDRGQSSIRFYAKRSTHNDGLRPRARAGSTTDVGTNACEKFPQCERLHHIIVCSELEPIDTIAFLATRGEHYDRNIMRLTHMAQHLQSIHSGQHDIQ